MYIYIFIVICNLYNIDDFKSRSYSQYRGCYLLVKISDHCLP